MITDSWSSSRAILNPCNIVRKNDNMPEVFISSFSGSFTRLLLKEYETEEIGKIYFADRIPIYQVKYGNVLIGYYESPAGASAAVAVEEMVFEMGAEKILYFGSCGCLDKTIPPGAVLIPERAYRDEGTSYHYMPASDYIDIDTSILLSSIFTKLGVDYLTGATWTTDALFRETEELAEIRRKEGCIAVEMECAALMAAAQFRKKKAFQFLFSADCLDGGYDMRTLGKFEGSMLKLALMAAKEL